MINREKKAERLTSYTPPSDVVSPEVWRPKLTEEVKARRQRRLKKGIATRPEMRRTKSVVMFCNVPEMAKLDELVESMRGKSTKFGQVKSRSSLLLYLVRQAHERLKDGRLRRVFADDSKNRGAGTPRK